MQINSLDYRYFAKKVNLLVSTLCYHGHVNHLQSFRSLDNRYFVMRHGRSKANELGLIISRPEHGLSGDYGLCSAGQAQALQAVQHTTLGNDTVIYTSDFSRAVETAEIVRAHLKTSPVKTSPALRERSFGNYEKTSHENYQHVWQLDATDPSHTHKAVESVSHVTDRVTDFIKKLESFYSNKAILLVSHGDTLQILQTAFQKLDGAKHRSLPHLETAEIRELKLSR